MLVLSLFPGADLFGYAFEALGACVVQGRDALLGGDVRRFRGLPGRFDIVIGGPCCQPHSPLARRGSNAADLWPEFVRVVNECQPRAAVMENVPELDVEIPNWRRVVLRDYDCGGWTNRRRAFWFYGVPGPSMPPARPEKALPADHGFGPLPPRWQKLPLPTVVATDWKAKAHGKITPGEYKWTRPKLTPKQAALRQGFPGLGDAVTDAQPAGVSQAGRACLAVHVLGNGVPFALGNYVARHVLATISG